MNEFAKNWFHLIFHPITLALAAIITVVSIWAAYTEASSAKADIPPVLNGQWHQTEGPDNVYMTAEIYDGSIQINMQSRDAREIYWLGTFDTYKDTSRSFKSVSLGDTDAMKASIFGSNSKTKPFAYEDGVISFEFSMMGKFDTVKLEKNKPLPKPKVTHTVDIPGMGRTYTPKAQPKVVPPPAKTVPRVPAPAVKAPSKR
jgi:hypothetical protein